MANYIGVKHAIFTSLGRTALVVALKALDVDSRCEVILPSFTCRTVIEAVRYCKARVVFADVNPQTFNVNPQQIRKAITPKTKAIIAVHCYGLPSDIDEILEVANKHDIPVIEDVAHALGAEYKHRKVGSFGSFSIFSFSKNMGAASGGALATDSDQLYEKAKEVFLKILAIERSIATEPNLKYKLLNFGRKRKTFFLPLLSSLKLFKVTTKIIAHTTEDIPSFFEADPQVTAEIADKLSKIDQINYKRIKEAHVLARMLGNLDHDVISLPMEGGDRKHVYWQFICVDREQKYIDIAQQRYRDLIAQTNLFEDGALETAKGRGTACNSASPKAAQVTMELGL